MVIVAEILVSEFFPELKKENITSQYQAIVPEGVIPQDGIIPDGLNPNNLNTDVINNALSNEGTLNMPSLSDFSNKLGDDFDADLVETPSIDFDVANVGVSDFEGDNYVPFSQNVYIREDQIRSAGFATAYLEQQADDGYLFKNVYIADLSGIELDKTAIRTSDALLAKVYVLKVDPDQNVDVIFNQLKLKSSEGLDIEINQTNEYGMASFYMNDSRRPNVAFLTVRMSSVIYGFSYPKQYHPQIRNLIQLIDLEF